LKHPVRITPLAETDIASAQDSYESREPGLGQRFVEQVRVTVNRIADNPLQYQVAFEDARRAPVHVFPYALWYRVLEDESIIIACLAHRQDDELAKRRVIGSSND
jgi:plasmid stabilization system protein ParE